MIGTVFSIISVLNNFIYFAKAYCGIDKETIGRIKSESLQEFLEGTKENKENLGSHSVEAKNEREEKSKNDNLLLKKKEKCLLELQKSIGNTAFFIEFLRNHKKPLNQLMSPLLSDKCLLKQFPQTHLIVIIVKLLRMF